MRKIKKNVSVVLKEYSQLIEQRKQIRQQIDELEEVLEINPKRTSNFDELTKEEERLVMLDKKYTEILARGNKDITTLSQDEELIFYRLQEMTQLTEKEAKATIKILGMRQGIMAVSDKDKSTIEGKLNEKYRSPKEFIEYSVFSRFIDVMRAYNQNRFNQNKIPEMAESEVKDLIVRNDELDRPLHPVLQEFRDTVIQTQGRIIGDAEIPEPIPFAFSAGEIEGEILINAPTQNRGERNMTVRELAEGDVSKELTTTETKGITKSLAEKFPALAKLFQKIFNKGNGER